MRSQGILSYFTLRSTLDTFAMNRIQCRTRSSKQKCPKSTLGWMSRARKAHGFPQQCFILSHTPGPDNLIPPVALAQDQLYHSMWGQKQFRTTNMQPSASFLSNSILKYSILRVYQKWYSTTDIKTNFFFNVFKFFHLSWYVEGFS